MYLAISLFWVEHKKEHMLHLIVEVWQIYVLRDRLGICLLGYGCKLRQSWAYKALAEFLIFWITFFAIATYA